MELRGRAERELRGLMPEALRRIQEALRELSENPHMGRKLKGKLQGLRRLRVGEYRVVCGAVDCRITVLGV